jgi:hypothetical protein
MKELIKRILTESVQNNDSHLIQEHIDTSDGSKFIYISLAPHTKFSTKRYYFNRVFQIPDSNPNNDTIILSGDLGDFEFNKNLVHYKDKETFYIDKSIFDIKYPKFTKKEKGSEKVGINSTTIKKALELAFPNNWYLRDNVFSPGLRGIYTIGDKIGDKTETWSIMNYFDTKEEIHDLLLMKYLEDGNDGDIIDWMVDLFRNNDNFTQKLVNRQWQSIESGLKLERDSVNSFFEVVNPSDIQFYPHGSIMDRYNGVDVTVDGSNYQIKPLVSYQMGNGMEYIITTYGMRDYKDKNKVDYIAYANEKEVLIFKNSDYSVVSKNKVIHEKAPTMEVINNEKIITETVTNKEVICDKCGWSWDISAGGDDLYMCHKCGHDNTPKSQSNLNRLLEKFKNNFPEELKSKVDVIEKFVVNYIQDHNFTVKFLNSCSTGFAGVRTKDQIIICSPMNMKTIGDFIYTIFHEIRHEEQMTNLKLENPLTGDLEDFEELSRNYWDLELDADRFAKEMIAKLVIKLNIPIDVAKTQFTLSLYIENYPFASKMVMMSLQQIVNGIKQIKKSGEEYTDIQDHPMIKRHLDKLENFI